MPKVIKTNLQAEDLKEKETQKVLTKMQRTSEEEQASVFAAEIGFPYLDTNLVPISNDSLRILKEEESRKYNVEVIIKIGKKVHLVSPDPTAPETSAFIQKLADEKGWEIKVFVNM